MTELKKAADAPETRPAFADLIHFDEEKSGAAEADPAGVDKKAAAGIVGALAALFVVFRIRRRRKRR